MLLSKIWGTTLVGGRRARAAALVAAALGALTVGSGAAQAARFTGEPFPYTQSGIGPFSWGIASDDPGGPKGSFAWKLSTEVGWHRCGRDGLPTLANLPEGRYTVSIADDISLDWYAARGLSNSGFTQPCFDPTVGPPLIPSAQSTLYVDSTPPTVDAPTIVTDGKTAMVSANTDDAISGVRTVFWSTGDGGAFFNVPFFRWTYLLHGTWTGSVTVRDNAGNETSRSFTVSLPTPIASAPAATTPAPPVDRLAPVVSLDRAAARRVLSRRSLALTVGVSARCVASATAVVKAGTRRYAFRPVTRTLSPRTRTTLRLAADKTLRVALRRALRRHERPVADVRITVTDSKGNKRVLRTGVRIRS